MEVKFYKCMHCGNIAIKVFDSGVPLVCCGEPMVELVADTQDASLEKHVPAVTVEGNRVHVNVGSVDHPMEEQHYIQFICLVKQDSYDIHPLKPATPRIATSSWERARSPSRSTSSATSTAFGRPSCSDSSCAATTATFPPVGGTAGAFAAGRADGFFATRRHCGIIGGLSSLGRKPRRKIRSPE